MLNLFLLQFFQSHGTSSIREQINFTDQVIQGGICSFYLLFWRAVKNREISRGVFQNGGVCGQAFPLFPSPSPFHLFVFCSRSNLRAITRWETLATQASATAKGRFQFWWVGEGAFLLPVAVASPSWVLSITPNAFEPKNSNCSNELRIELQSIALTKSRNIEI